MGFIFEIIAQSFFDALGAIFGDEWRERRGRKRQEQASQIDCGLRVIAGSQERLKNRWRLSRARVHSDRLEFGRRKRISVQVRALVTDRRRKPRGWEWVLFVDSNWQIIELTTESATLEWAVPADKLEWALARIRGSDVPVA